MKGTLLASFSRLLRESPRRTAIVSLSEQRALTFEDLHAEFRAALDALHRARLPERALVLCLTGNRAAFVPLLLACLEKNLVLAPLDGGSSPAEVMAVRERYGASALVTVGADGRLGIETFVSSGGELDVGEASVLKLTSGSTGVPKAVAVSEAQLLNDARHIIDAMGIGPDDVNLGLIPISHSYGLGNLVLPLLIQGTPLVLRTRFTPSLFQEDVDRTGATVFPGVPFMFRHFYEQALVTLPHSLRLLITAGARIDHATVAYFKERLGKKIHSFYGASETGGICYDGAEDVSDPLTVGRPVPETTVSFRDGRLFVRGNAVASGYVRGALSPGAVGVGPRGQEAPADESAASFVNGGFLTGDLGHVDRTGAFFLTGRVSSFVNVAGRKVSPEEVERVLLEMTDVVEAKVLGVPCEKRGQKLLACIVPRSEKLNPLEVRQHCARRLSPHKIPHDVVIVRELPVDARGKLSLKALETLLPAARLNPL